MSSEDVGARSQVSSSVSGAWRRLGAVAIDGLVLGVIGMPLGFALYDQLIELGQLGRIIGLVIAIAYFGALNSRLGAGQTIGKRLLGIRVVGTLGQTIEPGAATTRAVILTLPWVLNGLVVPGDSSILVDIGLSLGIFGIGGSILYLFLANRRSRQSLHDLAVHTWVVRADSQGPPPSGVPRIHVAVVAGLLCISLLLPVLASHWESRSRLLAGLLPLQTSLQEALGTPDVSLFRGTSKVVSTSGSGTARFLRITARLPRRVDDFEASANKIAAIALQVDDQAESYNRIDVVVSYGFDILITHMYVSGNFSHSPAEWRHVIHEAGREQPTAK